MIRTVGDLRAALEDAPDSMKLLVLISQGLLITVEQVVWMDERCVLDVRDGSSGRSKYSDERNEWFETETGAPCTDSSFGWKEGKTSSDTGYKRSIISRAGHGDRHT